MSSYDIANESPYFKNWLGGLLELSPDIELEQDATLQTLRVTSRKLIKNNFLASSAELAYINTILGGEIILDILGVNKIFDKEIVKFLDDHIFGLDISRQYSLSMITEQIIASSFTDGDVLINLPIDKYRKNKIKTYVELIDASRIKTPPKHKSNILVREGVEYYSSGKIKGYWVIKSINKLSNVTYYSANDKDFEFFPMYKSDGIITRKVCQLFKAPLNLKIGQSRNVPVLTGSMGLIRYFNQYLEAVLVGSRVAACFAGFIKTNNPAQARKSLTESGTDTTIDVKGQKLTKLQPGLLSYLKPNEDIVFASPNRPSDNFDNFILRLSKFIAMTIRIPYEQMFLDLKETSYSSWRGGSLETERNISRWKRDLDGVLRWIVFTFLQEALVKGELKGSLKNAKLQIIFPVYKTLDEEKSARARKINLQSNTTSQHREQAGMGENYDQLQDELDIESLRKVEREAKKLIFQKELSEKHNIIFPEQIEQDRDTSDSRREGEEEDSNIDEDDAKERRKEDGNW